jgi:lysophospholipase L1-like esterase
MKGKLRILCYGDSNTWGYISGSDHLRYNENERWTKLLQKQIGGGIEIIEEGLNSRTLFSDDNRPGKEGRNGWTYLKPCLDTHDKIDAIILMLGTNELKNTFNNSAKDIIEMLDKYVDFVKNYKSQIDKSTPQIIISGLPLISESAVYCKKGDKYKGASKKSKELNILCKNHFKNKILYIDNSDLQTGIDGVHMTKEAHKVLADKICKVIKEELKKN